jgi:hypothetical protein
VALHGGYRKGARLLIRLPSLARKRHPFANNRASRARFSHVDLLFEWISCLKMSGGTVRNRTWRPAAIPHSLRAIACQAAFLSGVVCRSRAASALPHSWTVPCSIT